MKRCTECNAKLNDNVSVCPHCASSEFISIDADLEKEALDRLSDVHENVERNYEPDEIRGYRTALNVGPLKSYIISKDDRNNKAFMKGYEKARKEQAILILVILLGLMIYVIVSLIRYIIKNI